MYMYDAGAWNTTSTRLDLHLLLLYEKDYLLSMKYQ